jgi:predicted O-methyltransferase YrrM
MRPVPARFDYRCDGGFAAPVAIRQRREAEKKAMTKQWSDVDAYFESHLLPADKVLTDVLAASRAGGLPEINVAPCQGMLLHILAKSVMARRILEIGTLGGYSSIWMARALQKGGRLVTLEVDPEHAAVAKANFARAGLADVIELRLGRAIDLLPKLAAEKGTPFDLVFIDADKSSNADYFDWALKMTRSGSLIVVDNVVRRGAVADMNSRDDSVKGVHRLIDRIAGDGRVTTTAIQTVGDKGYDGFTISIVN